MSLEMQKYLIPHWSRDNTRKADSPIALSATPSQSAWALNTYTALVCRYQLRHKPLEKIKMEFEKSRVGERCMFRTMQRSWYRKYKAMSASASGTIRSAPNLNKSNRSVAAEVSPRVEDEFVVQVSSALWNMQRRVPSQLVPSWSRLGQDDSRIVLWWSVRVGISVIVSALSFFHLTSPPSVLLRQIMKLLQFPFLLDVRLWQFIIKRICILASWPLCTL